MYEFSTFTQTFQEESKGIATEFSSSADALLQLSSNTQFLLKYNLNYIKSIIETGRKHLFALTKRTIENLKVFLVKILQDIFKLIHYLAGEEIGEYKTVELNSAILRNDFVHIFGMKEFIKSLVLDENEMLSKLLLTATGNEKIRKVDLEEYFQLYVTQNHDLLMDKYSNYVQTG